MKEKIDYDFCSLSNIFSRPEKLNIFARQRMKAVRELLNDYESFNCFPSCNRCCYGSILISYTEFNYILLYIQEMWSAEEVKELFRKRVGLIQDEKTVLCPFLKEEESREHCSVYPARPLICRVFGTTAAPCEESIEPLYLPENLFYQAYDLLYYVGNNFIALHIDREWALFEAPFTFWCLADEGKRERIFLKKLILEKGESYNAVIYDLGKGKFVVYRNGECKVLSRL